jgi:hypothetical protein
MSCNISRPPSRQSLRPQHQLQLASQFGTEAQGMDNIPVSSRSSHMGSPHNNNVAANSSNDATRRLRVKPAVPKLNQSRSAEVPRNAANNVSSARSSSSPRNSSNNRPASPTQLNRSDYLIRGSSPVKMDSLNRDRVWSASGHESRLALNPRAGEVLQNLLTNQQHQQVRKTQVQYYDSVSDSPKQQQQQQGQQPQQKDPAATRSKRTKGSKKARKVPSSSLGNDAGRARSVSATSRTSRTNVATADPVVPASSVPRTPPASQAMPTSISSRRPRSTSPALHRSASVGAGIQQTRAGTVSPHMTRPKSLPDVIDGSSGTKKRPTKKPKGPKEFKAGGTTAAHEAHRRRSSTTTATTLSSSNGGGDNGSNTFALQQELMMAEANAEIARTVSLLTHSIETVSSKLLTVCEEFSNSVQQMALNMSNMTQQSINHSLMMSKSGEHNLSSFSTPSLSHKKSSSSSSSHGRYSDVGKAVHDAFNEPDLDHLHHQQQHHGQSPSADLELASSETEPHAVIKTRDAAKITTHANGQRPSAHVMGSGTGASVFDSLDDETIENAVRVSLRNKLLKLYE